VISQAALDLIIAEEVSDKKYYERFYLGFSWPGGASGPTVGIGYDCGYSNVAKIIEEWQGLISAAAVGQLSRASGRKGTSAGLWARANRNTISIPWTVAIQQFQEREMPGWEDKVHDALPNTHKLSPDSFGALVSLSYNRGCSYNMEGPRYAEMRAIKKAMTDENFAAIPQYFKSMARLWPEMKGLQRRRNHEANLFLAGLSVKV
jgi:hypothetical protein